MRIVYENTIKSLGAMVEEFKDEGMFILFGDEAPDTLKDYCYCINVIPVNGEIKAGQKVIIDSIEYGITAVGDVANKNLASLGHVTFVFDGSLEAEMSGSIYVEKSHIPQLKVGSSIKITE